MPKVEAALFDVDGTLLNTFEHIVQAFERVLPDHGVAPDRETIRSVIGMTLVDCYRTLAPNGDAKAAAAQHHEVQQEPEMYDLIVAYDGLKESTGNLHKAGIKSGVVTNRSRQSLDLLFSHIGIHDEFDVRITPDDVDRPKPDPQGVQIAANRLEVSLGNSIMIGDTAIDVLTAKNAGMLAAVGVTHGFGSRESLEAAGADYIIDSLGELAGLIAQIEQKWDQSK